MDKKEAQRQMRYSDEELTDIKALFNEDLLMVIRKFLFQGELNEAEQDAICSFRDNKTGLKLLRKTFLPTIDPNAPLFQFADIWIGISTADRPTNLVWIEMSMKDILGQYLDVQLRMLEGEVVKPKEVIQLKSLEFNENKNPEKAHVELGARNMILAHIDSMITQLKILATREETTDEKVARNTKNSSK